MVVFKFIPEAKRVLCCLPYRTGISILLGLAILLEFPANLLFVYFIKDYNGVPKCIVTYMYVVGFVLISIEMLSVCCLCTIPSRTTSEFLLVFSLLRLACLIVVVALFYANLKLFVIIGYLALMLLWAYICFLVNSFYSKVKQSKNEHCYNLNTHVEEGIDSVNRKKPEKTENYRASNPIVYSCASLMTSIENASYFWMDKAAKSRNVRNYRTLKRDKTVLLKNSNKICLTPNTGSPEYISESGTSKECANINIMDQSANSSAPNEYWKSFKSVKSQKHNKFDKTIKFSKSYDNIKHGKQSRAKRKKVVKCVKYSKRISWLYWLSGKHNKFRSFNRSGKKRFTQNLGVQCKKSNMDDFRGYEVPRLVTEVYESCATSSEEFFKLAKAQPNKSCQCSTHCPPVRCPKPIPEICPKPRKVNSPKPSKEKCPKPTKPSKVNSPKPSKVKCPKPPKPSKQKTSKPAKVKSPKSSKEKCPKPHKVKSPKPSKEKHCKPPKAVKPPKLSARDICPKPPKDLCPKPPKDLCPKPKPSKEKCPKQPKEKSPKPKKIKSSSSSSSTRSTKSNKSTSSSTSSSSGKKRAMPPKCPKPPKPPKSKKDKKAKSSSSSSGSMTKCNPPTTKESKVRFSKSSISSSSSYSSNHSVKSKAKPICNLPKPSAPKMEYSSKRKKRAVKHRLICIGPVNDSKQKVNVQLKIEIDEPECPPQLECGGECQPKPKCIEAIECECDTPKQDHHSQACNTTKTKSVKKPSKPKVSSKSCECMSLPDLSGKKVQKEIQCDRSTLSPKKTSQKGCDTRAEVGIQKRSHECECVQPDVRTPSGTKVEMKKKEKGNSNSCTCIVCLGDCKPPICKMSNKCLSVDFKKKHHAESECDIACIPSKGKVSPKSSPTKILITKSSCGCSDFAPGTKLGSKMGGQCLDIQPSKPKSSKSQKSNKSLKSDLCRKLPSIKSSKAMKCTIRKIKSNKCKIRKIKSMCKIKKIKSSKHDGCEEVQTKPKKSKNITNMGIQCGMGSMCGVIAPCLMDKQCGKDADPGAAVQCARSSIIRRDRLVATKTFDNLKKDEIDAYSSYCNRTSLDEVALHEGIDLTTLCSHDRSRERMCYAVLDQEDGTDVRNKIREDDGRRIRSEVQDLKNAVMGDWSNKDTVANVNETEVSATRKENYSLIKPHGFPTTYFTSKILRRKKDKSLINAMHGLHLVSWTPRDEEPQRRPKSSSSEKKATNTKNQT